MNKVAIYCRLSEEDRYKMNEGDDSESILNQKEMLTQYALEQNWIIYNIYSDDDYTGADRERPAFKLLLSDAKQRKFDIILCKNQARFTREVELVEKYLHGLFPLWNIRFVGMVDKADTANKGNKKSRQINGLVNEWYLEDMSDNIKSVFNSKRRNGYHIGAFALYGYLKDPNQKGHLIIDEEAAKIVRYIFTLFSQGYGKTQIARMLNNQNIPNPTEYKRLIGLRYKQPQSKQSTLWKYFAISDMLTNEIYIGNMVQGKYGSVSYKSKVNKPKPKSEWFRVEGTHEPIIDKDLWDRVQEMIRQKSKPFITGEIGIFSRKTRCMHCGYTMSSSKSNGKHYLKCSVRHIADNVCIGSFISVDKLEQAVIGELNQLAQKYVNKDMMETKIELKNCLDDQRSQLNNTIKNIQKKLNDLSTGIKNLYLDKVKGLLSEKDYIEFAEEFQKDKLLLEEQLLDSHKKMEKITQSLLKQENRREMIERHMHLEKLDRETVETLIDVIYIGKRIPKTRQIPIEIHWNF